MVLRPRIKPQSRLWGENSKPLYIEARRGCGGCPPLLQRSALGAREWRGAAAVVITGHPAVIDQRLLFTSVSLYDAREWARCLTPAIGCERRNRCS
jgi:hypothetical protein